MLTLKGFMIIERGRPGNWYWIFWILPNEKIAEKETHIHAEKQKDILSGKHTDRFLIRRKDNGKQNLTFSCY